MKKLLVFVGIVAVAAFGYLAFITADTTTAPVAVAAGKTYSATVYVAGMGGHFTKADVTVDPSNANEPIKVANLDRVIIGDKTTHPTHDARIDATDPNTMFWSTYVLDPQGKMHVGKSDLKTGKVVLDVAMTPDPKASGAKPPLYCASGQSKNFFMPVFMGQEGYVDVLDKKDLSLKHRVWVSDIGYAKGTYKFVHGINSPDMKTFILAINQAKEGKGTGDVDFILLDLASLEQGKMKVVAKNTIKGEPDKTLTFRQYFSNDGKVIFQSAADRLWVIDAKTLKLVDEKMMPEGAQLHDAMPTPDNKFAILTVRALTQGCDPGGEPLPGKEITDGVFMLYDAGAKKLNTKSSSACFGCHKGMGLGDKNAVLCGLDANFAKK
jgi:hypothetical protein